MTQALPSGWRLGRMGDICFQDRITLRAGMEPNLPYLGLEHIESETGEIVSVSQDTPTSTTFRFGGDHVLYGKLRPYLNKVALPDFEGRCSTEIIPLKPRVGITREFLAYALRRPDVVKAVTEKTTGARMPRTDMNFLMSHPVVIPPENEQRRIVDILKRADSIRRLRKQAIDTARQLIPALFIDMFGDPATNPKGWEVMPFSEVGTLDRGKSKHRPRNDPILFGGPYPFIQTGDVANSNGVITKYSSTYSEEGLKQSRLWPAGTLCITIAANIADTGVLGFDACFPDSVVGFIPNDKVRTEYVQYWLSFLKPVLESNAPQLAQKNINLKILRSLPIIVPRIELQNEFVARLGSIQSILHQQEIAQVGAESGFQSLLFRALSGGA